MRSDNQKAISFIIVASLISLLIGKAWVDINVFFYVYGLLATAVLLVAFSITYVRYRDPAAAGKEISGHLEEAPLVSCIVAVRNEERIIRKCVDSLIASEYANKEIIVVNDSSTDDTLAKLKKYRKYPQVKVVNLQENVGKKRALAEGMLRAKGEIFVFTDSDSILAPDAVARVVDAFRSDPLIGAVSGHCRALNANANLLTRIQDSWYEGQFSIRKAFESVYSSVTCVSGPLAAFRREAIYNFIPAWTDDSFLGQEFRFATDRTLTGFVLGCTVIGEKLKKKHASSPFITEIDYPLREWKVVYSKSAKAWTAVPDSFRRLLHQQIRWKKSFIRNTFFTGSFYWRKPLLPALGYYIHVLFVLVGPFIALRHLVYLPIRGHVWSLPLYAGGVFFVGSVFGMAYKAQDKSSPKWVYRPLMSLLSVFILSWLIFYSLATIRKMVWSRA